MSQTNPTNACLTVPEAAAYLRTRAQTVRALIRQGRIKAFMLNGRPRISPAALAEFEAAAAAKPAPQRRRRETVPREVEEMLSE